MKRFLASLMLSVITILALSPLASAHVRMEPGRAVVGRQTYTFRVPNEKPIPTTSVTVVVPDEVDVTGVLPIAGWKHAEKKATGSTKPAADSQEHTGAEERITEVTWSGGAINPGEYMLFSIATNYEGQPKELVWKALQTYADGTVVAWDDSSAKSPAPRVDVGEKSDLESVAETLVAVKEEQDKGFEPDANTWLAGLALVVGVAALAKAMQKPAEATKEKK